MVLVERRADDLEGERMTGPFRSDESAAVPRFAPTGTAPQRPKADPKKDVCPNCGEVANGCNYCRKTPAPVPQTEGEDK